MIALRMYSYRRIEAVLVQGLNVPSTVIAAVGSQSLAGRDAQMLGAILALGTLKPSQSVCKGRVVID